MLLAAALEAWEFPLLTFHQRKQRTYHEWKYLTFIRGCWNVDSSVPTAKKDKRFKLTNASWWCRLPVRGLGQIPQSLYNTTGSRTGMRAGRWPAFLAPLTSPCEASQWFMQPPLNNERPVITVTHVNYKGTASARERSLSPVGNPWSALTFPHACQLHLSGSKGRKRGPSKSALYKNIQSCLLHSHLVMQTGGWSKKQILNERAAFSE